MLWCEFWIVWIGKVERNFFFLFLLFLFADIKGGVATRLWFWVFSWIIVGGDIAKVTQLGRQCKSARMGLTVAVLTQLTKNRGLPNKNNVCVLTMTQFSRLTDDGTRVVWVSVFRCADWQQKYWLYDRYDYDYILMILCIVWHEIIVGSDTFNCCYKFQDWSYFSEFEV